MTQIPDAKGQLLWDSSVSGETFQENCDAIRAETPRALALLQEGQEALRQAGLVMTQSVEALKPGADVDGSEVNRLMVHCNKVLYEKLFDATVFTQKALDWLNGFFEGNPAARVQREAYRREIAECRQQNENPT